MRVSSTRLTTPPLAKGSPIAKARAAVSSAASMIPKFPIPSPDPFQSADPVNTRANPLPPEATHSRCCGRN
eukprot:gene30653-39927_t